MALTRRFFTSLAAQYRDARPNVGGDHPELHHSFGVWMEMVAITANALAAQNAMFNYGKFYEACGMPENFIRQAAG